MIIRITTLIILTMMTIIMTMMILMTMLIIMRTMTIITTKQWIITMMITIWLPFSCRRKQKAGRVFTVTPPITRHAGHSAHLRRQKMSYSTVFLFRILRSITMHFITLSVLKKERLSHVVCVVVVQDMTRGESNNIPRFYYFWVQQFMQFSLLFCLILPYFLFGIPFCLGNALR